MKTSEMIALLEKNPKLKFTSSLNGLTFTAFVNGREEIEFTKMAGAIDLMRDWQLVREPVPWQEALQAWANGKTIECVLNENQKETYYSPGKTSILVLTPYNIINGTWYIQDDADA
jgi:hypothetical protein